MISSNQKEGASNAGELIEAISTIFNAFTNADIKSQLQQATAGMTKHGKKAAKTVAKAKSKRYNHYHKGVGITDRQWPVWTACKALLEAKQAFTKETPTHTGFVDDLSGRTICLFMGIKPSQQQSGRISAICKELRQKGLLNYTLEDRPDLKGKWRPKRGFSFGDKA